MLDIVIAHYNEPWEIGRKLFWMLDLQRGIDWNQIHVTVVNDGGHRLPEDELARLCFPVEQLDIPHGGISAARNAGIDHATEEWIMFCDFDDCFASIYALRDYMTVLPADGFDFMYTAMLAEDGQKIYFTPKTQRFVFCHGKVYRRQFLIEQNIRFDEELTFQEDSLFNAIVIARTDYRRTAEITTNSPPYVWIRRENSVTNSGREDEAVYWHFRRNLLVTAEHINNHDRYCGMVTRTCYDAYYMLFSKKISIQMKNRILTEFTPWIQERKECFGKVDEKTLETIRTIAKGELWEVPCPDDHERIAGWINQI